MSTTAEEIRKHYPNATPVCKSKYGHDNYCVGGAVYRFAFGRVIGFPDVSALIAAFHRLNEDLSEIEAVIASRKVVDLNDAGDIEGAWEEVDRLLKSHP